MRAGWCQKQAIKLILTKQYDACISLGSGFSLLTYHVANQTSRVQNIRFVDVDLKEIISERSARITSLAATKLFDPNPLT